MHVGSNMVVEREYLNLALVWFVPERKCSELEKAIRRDFVFKPTIVPPNKKKGPSDKVWGNSSHHFRWVQRVPILLSNIVRSVAVLLILVTCVLPNQDAIAQS